MAVPPPLGNPTWQTIPTQTPYPGQRITIDLRRFNSRGTSGATFSLLSTSPTWVTLSGFTLTIATPTSATNADRHDIRVRASAADSQGNVINRDTTFVLAVRNAIAPTVTPTRQDIQAGVPFSLDVSTFLDSGTGLPTPTWTLRGTQNPTWLSINGSTISGTPPVRTYTDPTTDVSVEMTVSNIGGSADFTVDLRIARSVGPGVQTIPAQYAVLGERFEVDLAPYLGGSPTPTLLQTGLPSWLRAVGTTLRGTPTGYSQSTAETITIHLRNVVGEITHTFQLYVRVADETFTHATTGSPIETVNNNLTALTATDNRFYYYSTDAQGHITVANHGGSTEASEQVNLGAANGANSTDVTGLAAHDGFLYVLGGTGSQWVFKYRLSDRSLVGTQNVAGAAVALAIFPRNNTHYLGVLRTTGTVQVWGLDFPSTNQIALDFTLNEPGVPARDWQSMVYDSLDDVLYAGAQGTGGGFLFSFSTDGTRDADSAIQLQSGNDEPRGAGYGDDQLFVAQHDSGAAQGNIYVYDARARVLPIPAQEGFDGEPWTFDLSPYLANSLTVAFRTGYSVPAWLTLTGKTLSATALPAVSRSRMDDEYTILLTGTHASRSTDFSVTLTVKYIEAPTTRTAPAQELDLRVTPTIQNVNPPLRTSVVLHMSDYVTNRDRAGTITYSIQFDDENLSTLTSRTVDGVMVNDVLTIRTPTTALADEPVSSVNLDIQATNAVGNASIDVPVDITNLMPTFLNAIPNQDIHRNEIDTINLQQYAGGRPRPTFALGTIVPTLTEDVAQVISNANGMWSIRPNTALETTGTYTVNVIAINRISRATRSFSMTIHGVPHTDPDIAPVWHTTGLTFDLNVGTMRQIDLATLINMSRPQPTFTLENITELTDVGARASIAGTILTITAPSSMDLDSDYNARIQIGARNRAGGSIQTLMIDLHYVSAPVWQTIPHQRVRPGETWMLDLNAYVAAEPDATITFNPAPTGIAANATLTVGIVTWVVPATVTKDSVEPFTFQASNAEGMADVTVGVAVVADTAPVWTDDPIILSVQEGTTNVRFDMSEYLTAGVPPPSLYLGTGDSDVMPPILPPSQVPADIGFMGSTLVITPTFTGEMMQSYRFNVIARNSSGMATKAIQLDIHPVFEHSDRIVLSAADYEAIRKLIDTTLTIQDLPDEIISADTIVGGAVAWAINRMPVYPDNPRTLEELSSKRRAVLYRAAGILVESVIRSRDPREVAIGIPSPDHQAILFAEAERSASIAQDRFVELGIDEETAFDGITFEVANGTRNDNFRYWN